MIFTIAGMVSDVIIVKPGNSNLYATVYYDRPKVFRMAESSPYNFRIDATVFRVGSGRIGEDGHELI